MAATSRLKGELTVSIHEGIKRFYKLFDPGVFKFCLKTISRQLETGTDIESLISNVKTVFVILKAEKEVVVFEQEKVIKLVDDGTQKERADIDAAEFVLKLKYAELGAIETKIAKETLEYQKQLELKYNYADAIAAKNEAKQSLTERQDSLWIKVSSFYKDFDISMEKFLFEVARHFSRKSLHSDALRRHIVDILPIAKARGF